ncbi:uncharacterized protein EV420DRAFT_1484973 [Desarmillaria tabescens]|uniref:Uncharacterized protein n=1 Tax=Armillaria tabescens TaxID=1929756 RepID=A0AA39MR06_ARMTA|nr:uncharacterized protein EV420DRAFT_1484973 [Desarmillaria tabescens]KAK0443447.1 hypothetical protein EV420DRAFT_1484973 [Desarmillaria tabescens]
MAHHFQCCLAIAFSPFLFFLASSKVEQGALYLVRSAPAHGVCCLAVPQIVSIMEDKHPSLRVQNFCVTVALEDNDSGTRAIFSFFLFHDLTWLFTSLTLYVFGSPVSLQVLLDLFAVTASFTYLFMVNDCPPSWKCRQLFCNGK